MSERFIGLLAALGVRLPLGTAVWLPEKDLRTNKVNTYAPPAAAARPSPTNWPMPSAMQTTGYSALPPPARRPSNMNLYAGQRIKSKLAKNSAKCILLLHNGHYRVIEYSPCRKSVHYNEIYPMKH